MKKRLYKLWLRIGRKIFVKEIDALFTMNQQLREQIRLQKALIKDLTTFKEKAQKKDELFDAANITLNKYTELADRLISDRKTLLEENEKLKRTVGIFDN